MGKIGRRTCIREERRKGREWEGRQVKEEQPYLNEKKKGGERGREGR